MSNLSDIVERKFVDTIDLSELGLELEIESDTGWVPLTHFNLTVPYDIWTVKLASGIALECADTHILFRQDMSEVFAKDLLAFDEIMTKNGPDLVLAVYKQECEPENMFDLTVDSEDHRYYCSNGILHHNTTIAAAILLWHILFHKSYTIAILANKADSAQEILERIQMAYESLPFWLQRGVAVWNKRRIVLDNKSKIFTAATSASGIRGKSVNLLYLDEFAHITLNLQEAFFSSTYPTITSGKNTKVIITSTPKGFEMFHKFWKEATVDKDDNPINTALETPIPGKNGYVAIETRWNDIPGRDEEWKDLILGTISQEQFDQEYSCAFLGSSGTLISGVHLSRMVYRKPILTRQYTNVYYKPEKGRQYVAVVDTSRGVGADHNVCSVFDVTETPFRQAMIIRSNQVAPQQFPEYIASACKAYNDAPVLVETNDNGQQIADALHFDLDVDSVLMTSSNAKKGQTISGGYGANARRGVKTSTAVKRIGCSTLKALIENNVLLIEDFETIQELSSFVSKGNSYEAESGKHDDIVATLFLFAWLTTQRYFKELTNKDARGQMASDHASAMEEELAPFGFFGFEMDDADFES